MAARSGALEAALRKYGMFPSSTRAVHREIKEQHRG
jgi:hypothetical protein